MASSSSPDKRPTVQDAVLGRHAYISFQPKSQPDTQIQSFTAVRLRKHSDYQRAYASSRKRQSSSMSWFLARQTPDYAGAELPSGPRVGLTAGKVLGKAHERNRIERRMREVLRRHVEMLPASFDLILHPRRLVLTLEFAKLEQEVVRILHQASQQALHESRIESARTPHQSSAASVTHGPV